MLLADRIIVLGKNPGRIRTDFQVGLPQPRDRKSPGFLQIVDYIYKVLTQPDAAPQIAPETERRRGAARASRARNTRCCRTRAPAESAACWRSSTDRGGHDDIYHLADDLSFEIDDVLPIVEAASMLGFVNVSEGDVEMTPEGRQYVDADIAERKEIFGKAALERVDAGPPDQARARIEVQPHVARRVLPRHAG